MRVFVEAYIATAHLKPKVRAAAFLDLATDILATEESVALTLPIRPMSNAAGVSRARRGALALFRQYLPTFLARLPRF
jgi:hypothetical protein